MYIVFDLETNGIGNFRPIPTQTITQLAYIKFNNKGDIIHQDSHIVKGATQINNSIPEVKVTIDDINNKGIPLEEAILKFFSIIDDEDILFSHNTDFDKGLINQAIKGTDLYFPKNKLICTMKNSTNFCKLKKTGYASCYSGYKWPALHELASILNVNVNNTMLHDALYDCLITKECVLKGILLGVFLIN
ncbi:MAG: hypothetical protein CMG46_01795 [Candidatus Marinimicrobia bacterium]|nr:hypothetical protein [Candidatus Neomarinimicrobiota bacterium]|tara:strand:+ start:381 stop:950 length:570 start_codon:yes stop_codon:yes gene_type:complete